MPITVGVTVGCMLVTYLICGIPFGFIFGELFGKGDIRKSGSGNIGTTNALRVGGAKMGALTLLCDVLKGVVCVLASRTVMAMFCDPSPTLLDAGQPCDWALSLVCVAALAGHMFTPYLHFKGGKGIAVGFGVCVTFIPPVGLSLWVPFLIGVIITRYVSVGSMLAAISLPFLIWFWYPASSIEMRVAFAVLAILVVWAHRSNIKKLVHGNESKLSFGSKKEDAR
ncbi:acyl-phosphate glycerol 3-phosphate acyltransferase [Collinsella sp. An2]|nr:acyl-phosphate glycerol 3-phosphate acyltransferase [Collinsella sp. An2]